MKQCEWPFCHKPACPSCKEWDAKYSEGVDEYLAQLAEIREAKKRERKEV